MRFLSGGEVYIWGGACYRNFTVYWVIYIRYIGIPPLPLPPPNLIRLTLFHILKNFYTVCRFDTVLIYLYAITKGETIIITVFRIRISVTYSYTNS